MTRTSARRVSEPSADLTVAVIGDEAAALPLMRAFRGAGDVTAIHADPSDAALLDVLARDDVAMVAFTPDVRDVAGSSKRALLAGRHVFSAATPALEAKRYAEIDQLARRRGCVAMFDTGFAADDRVAFVKRMVSASGALWRARYIRSLRVGAADEAGIDAAALSEIALACHLIDASPASISAFSPSIDGDGESAVALLTLTFRDGRIARIDVALDEALERRETVIACDERTIVLDAYDARGPLRIHAAGTHRAPQRSATWHETVSEHPAAGAQDRLGCLATAFVAAVRARDAAFGNAASLADPAAVWETARRSMSEGGAMMDIARGTPRRPELRLIKGRGRGGGGAAPALAIVDSEPLDDGAA